MKITEAIAALKPGRKITGMAAALLPFDKNGSIAEDAFAANLRSTQAAGLTNAVNMDTGYVNLLTRDEKQRVLALTRDALGPNVAFVAGAYIEREEGDAAKLWRPDFVPDSPFTWENRARKSGGLSRRGSRRAAGFGL